MLHVFIAFIAFTLQWLSTAFAIAIISIFFFVISEYFDTITQFNFLHILTYTTGILLMLCYVK